jgi:16S rRNA (cytidine1402-2'-O)-methyltransferase
MSTSTIFRGRNEIMKKGTLFLIPSLLGESPVDHVVPAINREIISRLSFFIVEEVRTARRFLKKACPDIAIDKLHFIVFNEHSSDSDFSGVLNPLTEGHDTGLLSEAGLPCVADPGSEIVRMAHAQGITVCPLTGPSSLLLALMASGFNGQNFAFVGYLPIEKNARIRKLKELERNACTLDQTQIFIETPYRNLQLFNAILDSCKETTMLCIGSNLSTREEAIIVKPVGKWKGRQPGIDKKPTVFLLYHD